MVLARRAQNGAFLTTEGVLSVDTAARLSSEPVPIASGMLAYVRSFRAYFVWDETSTVAPDGVTVLAAPSGRYLRLDLADPTWESQADWMIDPVNGNDENLGTQAAPLRTIGELQRRWGELFICRQNTVVRVAGATPEVFTGRIRIVGATTLRFLGQNATQLYAGVVGAYTAANPAGNEATILADANAGHSFAAFVGARIRFTSGAANGAVCWIAKVNPAAGGNQTARITIPVTYDENAAAIPVTGTAVVPAPGDTYVIEQLPTLQGLHVSVDYENTGSQQVLFANLEIAPANTSDSLVLRSPGLHRIIFAKSKCRVASLDSGGGGLFFLASCAQAAVACSLFNGLYFLLSSCSLTTTTVQNNAWLSGLTGASNECIVQGNLQCNGVSDISTRLAIFDSVGNGLTLEGAGARVTVRELLYGRGHATFGVLVRTGSLLSYITKPTITGTSGDTSIAGAATAWAAVPFSTDLAAIAARA